MNSFDLGLFVGGALNTSESTFWGGYPTLRLSYSLSLSLKLIGALRLDLRLGKGATLCSFLTFKPT